MVPSIWTSVKYTKNVQNVACCFDAVADFDVTHAHTPVLRLTESLPCLALILLTLLASPPFVLPLEGSNPPPPLNHCHQVLLLRRNPILIPMRGPSPGHSILHGPRPLTMPSKFSKSVKIKILHIYELFMRVGAGGRMCSEAVK